MRGKSSLFAAALLLSGCSQAGKYPEQCGALLPGWKKPTDGYGVLTLVNKVHISRDGDLRWNGRKITKDELRSFAATLPEMNPIPFTTLEVELGTSCDEVGAVREIVDRNAKCGQLGTCGEGAGPWARIGDIIGPNGETYKYYPGGRSETMEATEDQRAALNVVLNEADAALQNAGKQ